MKTGDCSRPLVRHTRTNVHRTSDVCAAVHIADYWWIADEDVNSGCGQLSYSGRLAKLNLDSVELRRLKADLIYV